MQNWEKRQARLTRRAEQRRYRSSIRIAGTPVSHFAG
jgi:hypothetical protein